MLQQLGELQLQNIRHRMERILHVKKVGDRAHVDQILRINAVLFRKGLLLLRHRPGFAQAREQFFFVHSVRHLVSAHLSG